MYAPSDQAEQGKAVSICSTLSTRSFAFKIDLIVLDPALIS